MTRHSTVEVEFRAISDGGKHDVLREVFDEYWPVYRKWMSRSEAIGAGSCVEALRSHMPELVPVFESLLDRFGGQLEIARFLTLYNPPPLVRACSQLVVNSSDGPALIRSYDHHPDLFDGVVLWAEWQGVRTLAVTDCLWGALDGINEHGLAVALAFGGRKSAGNGFAAPLIVRYLLQTCSTTEQARRALRRLPAAMPYTFVVLDGAGDFVTAFLGPGRTPRLIARRASTNHQGRVEWPAYARHVESVPRLRVLEGMLNDGADAASIEPHFLRPPLWRRDYSTGSGTLYVSRLDPNDRAVTLLWPAAQNRRYSVASATEESFTIELQTSAFIR